MRLGKPVIAAIASQAVASALAQVCASALAQVCWLALTPAGPSGSVPVAAATEHTTLFGDD